MLLGNYRTIGLELPLYLYGGKILFIIDVDKYHFIQISVTAVRYFRIDKDNGQAYNNTYNYKEINCPW